jgi:GDPmannose 4,6-dehydratase
MWLMLQHEKPGDYVVGTGETHSIRDICEVAFSHVGRNWQDHVVVDARLVRSSDNRYTKADTEKARRILGWTPSVSFRQLIKMMVDARIHLLREKASTASKRSSHA